MAPACVVFMLTLKGCVAESFTSLGCFVFVEWERLQGVCQILKESEIPWLFFKVKTQRFKGEDCLFGHLKSSFNMRQVPHLATGSKLHLEMQQDCPSPILHRCCFPGCLVLTIFLQRDILKNFPFVLCSFNQCSCLFFFFPCIALSTLQDESEALWV